MMFIKFSELKVHVCTLVILRTPVLGKQKSVRTVKVFSVRSCLTIMKTYYRMFEKVYPKEKLFREHRIYFFN